MIAIDVREACRERPTGKGQWTRGFVGELLTREFPLRLYTDAEPPDAWHGTHVEVSLVPDRGLRWHLRVAGILRSARDLRAYISPTSTIVPSLVRGAAPCVPVVHDLISFRREPHDRKARFIERLTLGPAVRSAKKVLTASDTTKQDLLAHFPSLDPARVIPIYAGPLRSSVPLSVPDGKTILCVATLCPRKNQLRLIQAYAQLPPDLRSRFRLVLVGARGWHDQEIVRLAQETAGVEWRDYVDDREYERLLSTCTVFALPSLYEGFGMQILDALQRGIPVLTSDRGSLREVTGDAAMMVDPENAVSIMEGLQTLLVDHAQREHLRSVGPIAAAKFSWERTVDMAFRYIT